MLHLKSIEIRKALKSMILLPVLANLLWSFNVSEISLETSYLESILDTTSDNEIELLKSLYQNTSIKKDRFIKKEILKSTNNDIFPIEENIILLQYQAKINKDTTDEELADIKNELKANYAIDFNFAVSRNSGNEIISLAINYSGNGNNGSFQVSEDKGIDEFTFFIDENGTTGFWSEASENRRKEILKRRNNMMHQRKNHMKNGQLDTKFEQKRITTDEDTLVDEEERGMRIAESIFENRNRVRESRKAQLMERQRETKERIKEGNIEGSEDLLYYVDGKETSKEEIKLIAAEIIKKVNVLKGKDAIIKYGGKGVNGVIEISTKSP